MGRKRQGQRQQWKIETSRYEWKLSDKACPGCMRAEYLRWCCYQGCRAAVCAQCAPQYDSEEAFYCYRCGEERVHGP